MENRPRLMGGKKGKEVTNRGLFKCNIEAKTPVVLEKRKLTTVLEYTQASRAQTGNNSLDCVIMKKLELYMKVTLTTLAYHKAHMLSGTAGQKQDTTASQK